MQYQPFTSEYVQRLVNGDRDTEQHFTSYFTELLLIKLRRTLRSYHAIEDVRQETFLRVFRVLKGGGLTRPESLGAFVNGVCNNVLAEFYRSVTWHEPLEEREASLSGMDPEQAMETKERKQCVRNVLCALPPKDREILRLIFLEEQDKDHVCRICQVDRAYLRVLLHRAKNRFRKHLPPSPTQSARAAFV